jgi:hypothetical protein
MARWIPFSVGLLLATGLSMNSAAAAVYKACVASNDDKTIVEYDSDMMTIGTEIGVVIDRISGGNITTAHNRFGNGAGPEWKRGMNRFQLNHNNNKCFKFHVKTRALSPDPDEKWEVVTLNVPQESEQSGSKFTWTLTFKVSTEEGPRTYNIFLRQLADGSGQAGTLALDGGASDEPAPRPPTAKHAPGVSFDIDENDFMVTNATWTQAPPLCLYSQPNYGGKEFCVKEAVGVFGKGKFFADVQSWRIKKGYRIELSEPEGEECDSDKEECLVADASDGPVSGTIIALKPNPKTRKNLQGYGFRASRR